MKLVVHSANPDAVFAHIDHRLLVMIWRHMTREGWNAGASMLREVTGSELLIFGVVEDTAKLPDATFREQSAELMSSIESRMIASATLIAKQGLMGTAMRSVLTGVSLLSRTNCPQKVFAEASLAATWLTPFAEKAGLVVTPSELAKEVESLRHSTAA